MITITYNGGTTYTAWQRKVSFTHEGKEYAGTLSYSDYEGYEWDGDALPDFDLSDNDFYYLLEALSCDCGCVKEPVL